MVDQLEEQLSNSYDQQQANSSRLSLLSNNQSNQQKAVSEANALVASPRESTGVVAEPDRTASGKHLAVCISPSIILPQFANLLHSRNSAKAIN